ncbi:MAG: MurR/RpiR family transcriptional regulator [Roseburia sp.]|nr:MurR/RpiR family transcriptional regulator [Anaeroplasma bactoclasticum]MCM1195609.1 MurR/RpiR family transcriptional regulator [Roseburia sp.]MCM1556199.1 MurR/RpiR family transcriptional regulator [Anaeroplasma bactoclasticum]
MVIDKIKLESILVKEHIAFSKTEKSIHKYIIENPEQVIYDTLNSITTKLHVGEASIVRYFKKLGYTNFITLKMDIYQALQDMSIKNGLPFIDNITENMLDVIQKTKASVDMKAIEKATDLILSSKQVLIAGMGTSHTTALDMFSKIIRTGVNAIVINDSHFNYMYTAILNEESCAVIYSFSGETEEMVKFALNCKEKNVKIIVISNYSNSTLYSLADVFLKTNGFENEISGGFFCSKISQVYVCDILVTSCAMRDVEKTKKYVQGVTNTVLK